MSPARSACQFFLSFKNSFRGLENAPQKRAAPNENICDNWILKKRERKRQIELHVRTRWWWWKWSKWFHPFGCRQARQIPAETRVIQSQKKEPHFLWNCNLNLITALFFCLSKLNYIFLARKKKADYRYAIKGDTQPHVALSCSKLPLIYFSFSSLFRLHTHREAGRPLAKNT